MFSELSFGFRWVLNHTRIQSDPANGPDVWGFRQRQLDSVGGIRDLCGTVVRLYLL